MDISAKSTDELLEMAFQCLSELQARTQRAPANVVFKQTRDTLVYENGIPADRKGWLYLPCLESVSHLFQPIFEGSGKIYRKLLLPGTTLQFSGLKGKQVVISDKGPEHSVEVDGAFVSGPIKVL